MEPLSGALFHCLIGCQIHFQTNIDWGQKLCFLTSTRNAHLFLLSYSRCTHCAFIVLILDFSAVYYPSAHLPRKYTNDCAVNRVATIYTEKKRLSGS